MNEDKVLLIKKQDGKIIKSGSHECLSSRQGLHSNESPSSFFRSASISQSLMSNTVLPRAPTVHFYVCDHGNARVQTVSNDFINLLLSNGINVFPEIYPTHQAGFQVKASSQNSQADFFIQVHSKTAGSSHVRLFVNNQPKRMKLGDAICHIWAGWRLKTGMLSSKECELLSKERLEEALCDFAGIEQKCIDIDGLQHIIREAVDGKNVTQEIFSAIRATEDQLQEGRKRILSMKEVLPDFHTTQGARLGKFVYLSINRGLSAPFRELLLSLIDQTLRKVKALNEIASQYTVVSPIRPKQHSLTGSLEIPIENNSLDVPWDALCGSLEQESLGMNSIASFKNVSTSLSNRFQNIADEF